MSTRTWAQARIVAKYPRGLRAAINDTHYFTWSTAQCATYLAGESRLHRFLVGLDMAFGQWTTPSAAGQDATISSNTARQCLDPPTAATWNLLLGTALELINPGHLRDAIIADHCRAVLEVVKP